MRCNYEHFGVTRDLSEICRALDSMNPFKWLEFPVRLHLLLLNRDKGIFQKESEFVCFGVTFFFFLNQSILFIVSAMSTAGKRSNTISTSLCNAIATYS